ncbi:ThuA domain-containing protein [Pseudochryseolinea flava]|uniref:Cytochrome C n=1 Tax=Pseudochryseolinea flava TaxID=2059302 RepID=A0A364Y1Q1_9BACT|nr:ThuA domain-containing protein [Pseudochryseolinea flava]RAW00771.1 cytochrome C [Pseudochryseolinea flava]
MHLPQRALTLFVLVLIVVGCSTKKKQTKILVFSKTTVFRHESIAAGIAAIKQLAATDQIIVDTTENADRFNEENLKQYSAVIFLSTTGDVLNQQQQNDFERFIQAGGGYVGIHAASDTEYDWPWYGKLVGAYFESHPNNPNVREGEFFTIDKNHPSSDSLPDRFKRSDEFYNFKKINPDIKVLVKLDEKSYEGGTNGDNHPISWYHEYDGGRAFYTAMGHTNESFSEPLFLRHLRGGLEYVLGGDKPVELDFTKARTKRVPEENRFAKVVLDEKLNEPVELAVLPDSRVLFIERKGALKLYDPAVGKTKLVTTIPVSTKYKFKDGNQAEAEDGLLGLALDPNFSKNNWLYLYYSPAGEKPVNILTRYEFKGDQLIESSKKVLLEVDVQREQCCHTGGSIAFDGNGNLFVSTGDNTSPRSTAYAPMDDRAGRNPWDAQKGTSNTNDLRGKILRIHPEADGTYTIPDGNLFPKGTAKTRPEIYAMGARNPYRISVDKKTGYLYWGDVGPDAGQDSVGRGPRAYDEINQARKPGFFGWPYFIGDNSAYNTRDFKTGKQGAAFDPAKPVNNSANNTGLTELPPAQKAFIWYPYDVSPEFPLVGKGGRTAMAGPVFYTEDFNGAKRAFPDYYNGKLFIYEWMRGWIMAVTMDEQGNYVSMERFMPSYQFSNPMDMEFGPDGDLYMLEYGTAWFMGNDDARLVRIEYNGGNRKPVIRMAADKTKGAVPLSVNLSAAGTKDYDRDDLSYEWKITSKNGETIATLKDENTKYTFDKVGEFTANLTVTDSKGEKASNQIIILAGNEPPVLSFDIMNGNKSFFFPNLPFDYEVKVSDQEDGALGSGITEDNLSITIDYLKEGFDKIEIAQGHLSADATAQFAQGKQLMEGSDCKACHIIDKKSVGPMYIDIAKKYKDDPKAVDYLAKKIINGGGGVWGDVNMAAHPQLSPADASEIVRYILSLAANPPKKNLPAKGTFTPQIAKGVPDQGVFILRAAYTDKGANGMPPASAEQVMVLNSGTIQAHKADLKDGVQQYTLPDPPIQLMIGSNNNAYLGFKHIDLTHIAQIVLVASAPLEYGFVGGTMEVRIDSPTGEIIGTSGAITPAKGSTPAIVAAPLKATSGFHDLYFIYKNDQAVGGQSLFVLIQAQMIPIPPAKAKISMR